MSYRKLYFFLDEGGNLDFSNKGSRYFSLSCISIERPFTFQTVFDNYKYDLIEYGLNTEFFHCSDDNSHVRKKVFEIIQTKLGSFKIDSMLVEKQNLDLVFSKDKFFYPQILRNLLSYVICHYNQNEIHEILIITDTIPINKKRKSIEKTIKLMLAEILPNKIKYRIFHHSSKAHYGLQLVDYCNWAILRKWERNDEQHYQIIKPVIRSELDISNGMKQGKETIK